MNCHVSDDFEQTLSLVLPNQPCSAPSGFNLQRLAALSVLTQMQSYNQPDLNDGYQLSIWPSCLRTAPESGKMSVIVHMSDTGLRPGDEVRVAALDVEWQ